MKEKFIKVLKGAAIAAAGAALAYITAYVADEDFGTWTPVVTAGWAVVVNLVRKLLTSAPVEG